MFPGRFENFADARDQDGGREGLLQEGHAGVDDPPPNHRMVRIARHVEHFDGRPLRKQCLRQFGAAHPRHHDVAEQQVQLSLMLLGHLQRLFAVGGFEDRIPIFFKHFSGKAANAVFVFGHENRLGAPEGEGVGAH